MSLIKKIIPYVLAVGIAFTGINYFKLDKDCLITDMEVANKLKISSRFVAHLPNCYKSSRTTDSRLRAVSGYIAGTAKLNESEKIKGLYEIEGYYDYSKHPEILDNIIKEIDHFPKDKIISLDEVSMAEEAVYDLGKISDKE